MWLDEIAEYLESLAVPGVPDQVFVQTIPAEQTTAVMLAGPQNGINVDPYLPGYHRGSLQTVVRAPKSAQAEDLAQKVSDALETEQGAMLDKIKINYIRPRHLPVSFPRSEGDFFEAVVNFDLCFLRLSA